MPLPDNSSKVCSICGQELPVDQFYVNKKKKDGYSPACKACFSYRDKEERQKQRRKEKALLAEVGEGFKMCSCCKKILPISQFCKCRNNKDGLEGYCKDCRHEKNKASKAKKEKSWTTTKKRLREQ